MGGIKISVIMPVYNAAKYLRQALDTIIAQTLQEFELICVDDGSTDSSLEILNEYAKHEPRMTVLRHTEYTDGAAEARNIGMRAAKGEYLAFVDSDDFFCPQMLEHAYDKAKGLDVDVLMFDAWFYNEELKLSYEDPAPLNGNYLPLKDIFSPAENVANMFRMTHGTSWGRLFKREFILAKKIEFYSCRYWDDVVFVYIALCEAGKIGILREKLLYYRYNHETSQTIDKGFHAEIGIKAPYELKRQFEVRGLYQKYRVPLINCILSRSISMLTAMKTDELFTEMFEGLKHKYLKEFGAWDLLDDEFYDLYLPACRNAIMNAKSPLDFWLLRQEQLNNRQSFTILQKLAQYIKGEGRLALYGAGMNGKKAFMRLMNSTCYSLCVWVDRNYKNIGFPVSNPENLRNFDFDYVFIAIESKPVVDGVRKYLNSMGISDNKIVWIPEIAICV